MLLRATAGESSQESATHWPFLGDWKPKWF